MKKPVSRERTYLQRAPENGVPTLPPPGEGRNGVAAMTCLLWLPAAPWRVQGHSGPRPDKGPLGPSQFCSGNPIPHLIWVLCNPKCNFKISLPSRRKQGREDQDTRLVCMWFPRGVVSRKEVKIGLEYQTAEFRSYKCVWYVLKVSECMCLKKAELIRTTTRYHFTPTRTAITKKTDNWNPHTAAGKVTRASAGETAWPFPKRLNTELPSNQNSHSWTCPQEK